MSVDWHDSALDRLADIYVAVPASDRDELARCGTGRTPASRSTRNSSVSRGAANAGCGSTAR